MSGEDGLREFTRSKAITTRRAPSPLPVWTFEHDPDATARRLMTVIRLPPTIRWLSPGHALTRLRCIPHPT